MQVKWPEDQHGAQQKGRCACHEVALCWYRLHGLLNQNKLHLPAAEEGKRDKKSSCLKCARKGPFHTCTHTLLCPQSGYIYLEKI